MRTIRTLFLALFLLPSITLAAAAQNAVTSTRSNGHMTWMHSDGDDSYEVNTYGEVVFKDDDRGIERISEGGSVSIKVTEGSRRVSLDVRPGPGGQLVYDYKVNGRSVEYNASSERDMADLFLLIIRESGINADRRVARILRQEGIDGVFEEIDQIQSSSSVVRYLTELVAQAELSARQLSAAAQTAENRIKSSGDRARFLRNTAAEFLAEDGSYDAFFHAIASISSSGDRTRTLMAVVEMSPNRDAFDRTLEVASGISSSGDKTRLLIATLGYFPNDPVVRDLYFSSVETISSSGDRSRLLRTLLTEYDIDAQTAAMAFEAAAGISSSGDKAHILVAAAPFYTGTDTERAQFFRAVETISSSGERARVLIALLNEDHLSKATMIDLLGAVRGISSSGEASRVLQAAAPHVSDDEVVDAYLEAANSISSAGERGRALTAIMDR